MTEKCVVRIKDALTNELEPLFCEASLINSLLVMEFNGELLLPRRWLNVLELLKTISEHLISSDTNINLKAIILLILPHGLLDEDSPQKSLAIEV